MKMGKCRIVMNIDVIRFVFYQWARCCLIDCVKDRCLDSRAEVFGWNILLSEGLLYQKGNEIFSKDIAYE